MDFRRLGALAAVVAATALCSCGGGTQTTSVPSSQGPNGDAPRYASERARHFSGKLAAAKAQSVQTHVQQEAAKGARVFRIEQVAVVDPVTHAHYIALRDRVKQTAAGIVVFMGSRQILLSPEAKIVTTDSYGYLFRRGSERDPDPSLHAVRIK